MMQKYHTCILPPVQLIQKALNSSQLTIPVVKSVTNASPKKMNLNVLVNLKAQLILQVFCGAYQATTKIQYLTDPSWCERSTTLCYPNPQGRSHKAGESLESRPRQCGRRSLPCTWRWRTPCPPPAPQTDSCNGWVWRCEFALWMKCECVCFSGLQN